MNICIVTLPKISPLNGGVENVCFNLAQHIARKKEHKIFSLYIQEDKNTPEIEQVEYVQLPPLSECLQVHHVHVFQRFLRDNSIDIVWLHSPGYPLSTLIKRATTGTKAKIVSIYHSSPYTILREVGDRHDLYQYRCIHHGELIPYLLLLLKLPLIYLNAIRKTRMAFNVMLDSSDYIALLSSHYISEFVLLSGCRNRNKLHYVTNPIVSPEIPICSTNKKNQLLVVCRHEYKHKRLDRILRIWKKIQHQHSDWKLVILGDGPAHQEYKDYAKRLELQRVTFAGKQKPDSYYAESKIICMTSSWEGLPMVLIEAQRYGCVPIAYESFSALQDIIIPGKTGICVKPFQQNEYISYLSMLMEDDALLKRLAQNSIQHSTNFSIEKVATRWIQIFKSTQSVQN